MQLKYSMEEVIPLPTVKIFLTGHIEAGKTALRQHLGKSKFESRPSLHQRTEERRQRTAGVEVENLEHDAYGSLVAYDLAGHCEYTASHSVVIDCGSNSIFLILFDVTGQLSKMKKEVNYWAAFIKAGRLKSCRPTVILVATHRDKALESGNSIEDLKTIYSCIFNEVLLMDYKDIFSLKNEKFIVNCLDATSPEMDHLRKAIGSSCEDIKKVQRLVFVCQFVLLYIKTLYVEQVMCLKKLITVKFRSLEPSKANGHIGIVFAPPYIYYGDTHVMVACPQPPCLAVYILHLFPLCLAVSSLHVLVLFYELFRYWKVYHYSTTDFVILFFSSVRQANVSQSC